MHFILKSVNIYGSSPNHCASILTINTSRFITAFSAKTESEIRLALRRRRPRGQSTGESPKLTNDRYGGALSKNAAAGSRYRLGPLRKYRGSISGGASANSDLASARHKSTSNARARGNRARYRCPRCRRQAVLILRPAKVKARRRRRSGTREDVPWKELPAFQPVLQAPRAPFSLPPEPSLRERFFLPYLVPSRPPNHSTSPPPVARSFC